MANNYLNLRDPILEDKLKAAITVGLFANPAEFVKESVNTFLASRKDARIAIACELYKEGKISLGKTAEIADLNIEKIKRELNKRSIKRNLVSFKDQKRMLKELLKIKNNL